jgi:hypothetical protein
MTLHTHHHKGPALLPAITVMLMIGILMTGISHAAADNGLRAFFDRSAVYTGETVSLTIEADGRAGGQPDLAPLQQDFTVLRSSQGSEIRIVNGRRSDTTRWTISLQPLTQGKIEIPPLSVGGRQTTPLTLTVRDLPPEIAKKRAESLFIETEIGDTGAGIHVQQQIPMTVRLYAALPIRDGTLSDPAPVDTVVERLGEDRSYSVERNGKRYQVIERHYALFPERSGSLTIPPVVFRGSVAAQNRGQRHSRSAFSDPFFNDPIFDRAFGNSGFAQMFSSPLFSGDPMGMFGARRSVSAQSEALIIEVQPRPTAAKGRSWLPASDLQLSDSWVDQPPDWQVGKPVERTVTLRATGLAGSQIPQITFQAPTGVRVYPGKPEHESRTDGDRIFGISKQSVTYIPTKEGTVEIPGLQVNWWDINDEQNRVTSLPKWQVPVAPGTLPKEYADEPVVPATTGEVSTDAKSDPGSDQAAADDNTPIGQTLLQQVSNWRDYLPWLAGGLGLLIVLYLLTRRSKTPPASTVLQATNRKAQGPDMAQARTAFFEACDGNDPNRVARALLGWAAAKWPNDPPTGLLVLVRRLMNGAQEIKDLEQALYAPGEQSWDATALREALSSGLQEKAAETGSVAPTLAPLYPQAVGDRPGMG